MKHTLPEGQSVIDALERFGRALQYETTREHVVGESAAVDLSWTAAASNDVPLFIFEVESTASAGLANNAMKVFGAPLETLAKPLFFFHLVLAAGPTNERVLNAQRVWGSHNYRIYRISDPDQRRDIVADVLTQHRRVSNRVNIVAFVNAVEDTGWGDDALLLDTLTLLQGLRFDTPYLHALARLALVDLTFLPTFARRVCALSRKDVEPPIREGYDGGPGDYIGGLLELALAIASGELTDEHGPTALEAWATSTGSFPRVIDAAFGLSRDYDGFILGVAPFQYAIAAAVLQEFPQAMAWVVHDLHRLLVEEESKGVSADYRLVGGVWLPHLLVAAYGRGALAQDEAEQMYSSFQRCAADAGGVPEGWLASPPPPSSELQDLDDHVAEIGMRVQIPSFTDLIEGTSRPRTQGRGTARAEALHWCLGALVDIDAYGRPTSELVALLADD